MNNNRSDLEMAKSLKVECGAKYIPPKPPRKEGNGRGWGRRFHCEPSGTQCVGVGVVGRGRGPPTRTRVLHGIEALLTPDTIATGYIDSPSLPLWWSELAWQAHCTVLVEAARARQDPAPTLPVTTRGI